MYIASCSFGKDSIAQVILAHLHDEPLDLIVYSEVMFDRETSGEIPEHIEFIYEKAIPVFEKWGYKVEVVRSPKTFCDCFYHKISRSKYPERIGKYTGFPLTGKCTVNRDCKLKPINDFFKQNEIQGAVQYIGIASDEPKRLVRLDGQTKISLLAKYNFSEDDAKTLCCQYGLLSPIYEFTKRGGCFFCPNAGMGELRHLYDKHKNLWKRMVEMGKDKNLCNPYFKSFQKIKLSDIEERFYWEDQQMDINQLLQ